ncbi:MAG TPA: VanW family protein [Actinomycetota bacterium]|nr:VanW family protein [Actinomycetota bacterium]
MIQPANRRVAVAGVLTLLILGGILTGSAVASAGEVVGGTSVGGVPVEGLEARQLVARLGPASRALGRRPLTLVVGDREWVRSPEALGISVDLTASARRALLAGRSNSFVWIFRGLGSADRTLEWVLRVDQARLKRATAELAGLVKTEASNGDFAVKGSTVTVTPPSKGYTLLEGRAQKVLVRAALRPSRSDRVELPVKVTEPEITTRHLERVKQQAEAILASPVDFVHEGRTFQVAAERIAPALKVKVVEGRGSADSNLVLHADPEILKERIVAAAPFVNKPARDAGFSVNGDKVTIQPSQNGSTIDTKPAAAALVALRSGDRRAIPLPSVVQPAALTTEAAGKLGIKQRISAYTTTFDARNAPRVGNIDRMASAIDGKVLKPGEIFSLNGATGERTVTNGYQEAGVLVDGELVPGIGGGVCQVATTLFNAVFSAGLDVVERSNHSLWVSKYPTGKDAMVNFGVQDLRFRNDTEYGLLLRARVSARELTVSIYSSPLGRTVTETTSPQTNQRLPELKYVDDPTLPAGSERVVEEGINGFDVTVTRKVVAGGKVLHSDNFVSKYRPWKRIIKRGTGPAAAPAPVPVAPPEVAAPPAPAAPNPSPSA